MFDKTLNLHILKYCLHVKSCARRFDFGQKVNNDRYKMNRVMKKKT